ncbi:MAG TPA: hypothetical protein VF220_04605 [Nitrososphaeraceae archaeon]
MKSISLEDTTYKRLSTIMFELMNERKKNLDYNDVINELIDMYQENTWGNFGAESAGG